jgi:23S rRNA pseudouridine1911/1915/1917 synthase
MPLVIEENEWLVAINKPAGLIVHHDGRTQEPTLADWIGEQYPTLCGVGGDWISPQGEHIPLNGLVHRLDRSTSGVIVAAKTQDSFDDLKKQFKDRTVEKKYLVWVYGRLSKEEGRIVAEIMRSSEPPKRWYAKATTENDPRAAITDWKLQKTKENASLLEVTPKTGRTHQIRVHMAFLGCPVVSDHLYAPDWKQLFGFTRPALHAYSIALTLPSGARALYTAELPPDFANL